MNSEEKALDFAQDVTKQFLALASAIPLIMITFSKDFLIAVATEAKSYALISWAFFLLSVFFGLLTLMALTGTLARRAAASSADNSSPGPGTTAIMTSNVRIFAALQITTFFIGLMLVVIFGWMTV